MAKSILIAYTTATADSLLAAAQHYVYAKAAGATVTLYDITGVSTGNITTWAGTTLVDNTYDEIYLDCLCDTTAASATVDCAQQYLLRAKLKTGNQGTLSALHTNADTFSSNTIGLTGLGWVVDAYKNAWVMIYSGTGAEQIATVASNTATVATIWGTFSTTPDATSDFYTITGMKLFMCGVAHTTTAYKSIKSITELAWAAVYPSNTVPLIGSFLGGEPGYALYTSTSTTLAAGTLTCSTASADWTTDCFKGMYCQIYSASTNSYQYAKIASNSTTVLTLTLDDATHYWSRHLTPTGNAVFKIVGTLSEVFNDLYIKYYILTYLSDLTSSTVLAEYVDLMDTHLNLNTLSAKMSPIQNVKKIQGTIIPTGKRMFDVLVAGVSA